MKNGMLEFNNRVGTPTNLPEGGTYDILLISFPDGFPNSKLTFDVGDTPRKVNGIQKVAQTFLKALMTSRGSDVIHYNLGTNFQQLVIQANVTQNDTLFMAELSGEIQSAENQSKNILNSYGSDTASQLEKITILGIDSAQESVVMYLSLLTKAGASANVAIPFPQLDLVLNG
jgi:hypothetical protein